ncbi:MAG: TonB-dependent receptor plug domain-containing protein, partial [Rikenellaceae bacterium]
MKKSLLCTVTLTFLFLMFSFTSVMGQNIEKFSVQNATLKEVITKLEKLTNVGFFYEADLIEKVRGISVTASNISLEGLLDKVFKGTNFKYELIDQNIVIKPILKEMKISPKPQPKKKTSITVKVIDKEKKEPVVGAVVVIKGTSVGGICDEKGQVVLANIKAGDVLEISCVGMKLQTVTVPEKSDSLVITMENDVVAVDDVVVTGIFRKAKESYTGAATIISSKELQNFKGQNLISTLKNIDPAINIQMDNNAGSNPNALPQINMRGNSSLPMNVQEFNEGVKQQINTPLIIMDGFEISLQKLMDYNDDEIETITLLKDAAATAIYGSRSANGVIVITSSRPMVDPELNILLKVKEGSATHLQQIKTALTRGRPNPATAKI